MYHHTLCQPMGGFDHQALFIGSSLICNDLVFTSYEHEEDEWQRINMLVVRGRNAISEHVLIGNVERVCLGI